MDLAEIYARLGDKNAALKWLETAYAEHSDSLVYLKVDPEFDSVRSDPRFAELLKIDDQVLFLAGFRITESSKRGV